MDRAAIIAAINLKIGDTDPRIWRIGIANDPAECKRYWTETEKKATFFWSQWEADTLAEAKEVIAHFVNYKGVKDGAPGSVGDAGRVFVYLF
ncbi:MAG: hypothetical protein AB1428_09850 [Bacteroidota bacterium]